MFWNATMPVWAAIIFMAVPLGALAIVGFAGWWHNAEKDHTELSVTRNQNNNLMLENVQLCEDLEGTRATIKARDLEIERLNKPDLTTLPLAEAIKPERPMRRVMKKKGTE